VRFPSYAALKMPAARFSRLRLLDSYSCRIAGADTSAGARRVSSASQDNPWERLRATARLPPRRFQPAVREESSFTGHAPPGDGLGEEKSLAAEIIHGSGGLTPIDSERIPALRSPGAPR